MFVTAAGQTAWPQHFFDFWLSSFLEFAVTGKQLAQAGIFVYLKFHIDIRLCTAYNSDIDDYLCEVFYIDERMGRRFDMQSVGGREPVKNCGDVVGGGKMWLQAFGKI